MERTSWKVEEIKSKLEINNRLVERAITLIYQFQTEDEKQTFFARHDNGVGFNKYDSEILSSFAKQINEGKHLTEKQMAVGRNRILKYAKQLTKIANDKLQEKYEQQSLI
jgi:hypothetical protein